MMNRKTSCPLESQYMRSLKILPTTTVEIDGKNGPSGERREAPLQDTLSFGNIPWQCNSWAKGREITGNR